jgi:hypothetical protein
MNTVIKCPKPLTLDIGLIITFETEVIAIHTLPPAYAANANNQYT